MVVYLLLGWLLTNPIKVIWTGIDRSLVNYRCCCSCLSSHPSIRLTWRLLGISRPLFACLSVCPPSGQGDRQLRTSTWVTGDFIYWRLNDSSGGGRTVCFWNHSIWGRGGRNRRVTRGVQYPCGGCASYWLERNQPESIKWMMVMLREGRRGR